jgi:hypothetical protein
MAVGRTLGVVAVLVVVAASGCVDRRFVIHSNVPNAQVFIDNTPIGAAPAYAPFEYYGYYTVTLVHPGYETQTQRVHVTAPWYAYPPFDFFAEVIWPFHIRDTRRYYFELQEATKTRVEDLLNNAEALRVRGWNLPQAERPAAPRPQPEVLLPVEPAPGSIVPPVGPAPAPELVPGVRP